MNDEVSDPGQPIPTLADIRAIERGDRPVNLQMPSKEQQREMRAKSTAAFARARQVVGNGQDDLGLLLQMGANGEVGALTMGGLAVLEAIRSPFLDEPVDGKLTITMLDTARALWAFQGGSAGCAPILSALAMERAAADLEVYAVSHASTAEAVNTAIGAPLRIRAAELRGQWDGSALQALEESGKGKGELDIELIARIQNIISELEILK